MGASSIVFEGLTHPATLEAIACSEAMSLALDLNLSRLQIATDCLQVVRNIKGDNPCSYGVIIKEILVKMALFQEVFISHENRACNIEAHSLVKALTSLETGRHVWLTSPLPIACNPTNIV